MRTAVIYLRVSTKEQAERGGDPEGYSIPAQRDACLAKAESLDATVLAEYADKGESAKSADRPELQKMLGRIHSEGGIDYVIVHKVDRLARNRYDDALIGIALDKAGTKLVSVSENIDDTPAGRFMHAVMAGFAELYANNLATEVIKGSTKKAEKGGSPMRVGIGYRNVRKVIDGREIRTVRVDPERGPLIAWAFETYATGDCSTFQLLDGLTAKGLTTVPTRTRPAHPLHLSNLTSILKNPYYTGVVRYRGKEYQGTHEPLVTPETFAKVQQVLAAHYTAGERTRAHPHYLKGTVFCDQCGARLTITKANGHGGIYYYFFCLGKQKFRQCRQKYLRVDNVEELVARQYGKVSFTPERAEAIAAALREFLATRQTRREKEAARQERRLARLKSDSLKLFQRSYRDLVPEDVFVAEQSRINREIAAAEAAIAKAKVSLASITRTGEQAAQLLVDCERAYRIAPDTVKRLWNQAFFEKVFVGAGDKVRFKLAEPFEQMLKFDFKRQIEAAREQAQVEAVLAEAKAILQQADEPALVSLGVGSSKDYLVGAGGIEPPASCL